MNIFRIARKPFSDKLFASGVANRWNKENEYVLYAAATRSLATLEMVVHRAMIRPDLPYAVMVIEIPIKEKYIHKIEINQLPENWYSLDAYSTLQKIGSEWYHQANFPIMRVPSVVISQEYNYVINTNHAEFEDIVTLKGNEPFFWDNRLL